MDCKAFLDCLADIVGGSCPAALKDEAQVHAAGCSRCAQIIRVWQSGEDPADGAAAAALTRSILARTSGGSCGSARERLPDYVDGTAGTIDAELVAGHLAGCASCQAIAETLSELAVELPAFADLDPGPGFAAAVARATMAATPRRASVGARFESWWSRLLERPRIGFELAYVGTLVLVVAFGNPAATLQAASAKTYALAETGLSQARSALPSIVPAVDVSAAQRARIEKVKALGDAVSQQRHGLEQRFVVAWEQAWSQFASAVSEAQRLAGKVMDSLSAWWANLTRGGNTTEPASGSGRYMEQERTIGA